MEKSVKYHQLLSIVLLSLLASCANDPESTSNVSEKVMLSYPEQGAQCYQSVGDEGITHLKLSIDGKNINGILVAKNQVWGNVIHDFSGKVISDSVYNIVIHNISKYTEQKWTLKVKNGCVGISGMIVTEITDGITWQFASLLCDQFPDISSHLHYPTVDDVEGELEGEEYENRQQ